MNEKKFLFLYSAIIGMLPALRIYVIAGPISLDVLLMFALIVLLLDRIPHYKVNKESKAYFIATLLITVLSCVLHIVSLWFSPTLMLNNLFCIFVVAFPLIIMTDSIDVKTMLKVGFVIGIAASLIVIWQRVELITTGFYEKDMYLPWFEINRDKDTIQMQRPSAFFTEPAHLCIFLLPLFYCAFLCKKYILAGLYVFAILCSGGTTGYVGIAILSSWIFFNFGGRHKLLKAFSAFALIVGGYFIIINIFPEILLENSSKLNGTTSEDVRLLGPAKYLNYFELPEMLAGVTLNQLYLFLMDKTNQFFDFRINYCNALLNSMISYGVLGVISLIVYLKTLWTKYTEAKGFFLIFLLVLASDQIFYNAHFLYLATFVILSNKIYSISNNFSLVKA